MSKKEVIDQQQTRRHYITSLRRKGMWEVTIRKGWVVSVSGSGKDLQTQHTPQVYLQVWDNTWIEDNSGK